jgi:hypothetical protein
VPGVSNDAVDPDNRFVAAELERRWNEDCSPCACYVRVLEDAKVGSNCFSVLRLDEEKAQWQQ